jgi:hypothetical protein
MNYYLCAYETMSCLSHKCTSEDAAAMHCFGVTDRVTVLNIGGRSYKCANHAKKMEWHKKLAELHKQQTGNDLQ